MYGTINTIVSLNFNPVSDIEPIVVQVQVNNPLLNTLIFVFSS